MDDLKDKEATEILLATEPKMPDEGPREQEQEEMAGDEIRQEVVEQELEANDDDDSGKRERRGEKRQHQDGGIYSGIHHSERSGYGHDTNDNDDEDDEEDENPRFTKQRRLFPASPDMPPTPPLDQSSPRPYLARPHTATPSSTMQLEIGDAQSQTGLARLPTSLNNGHHHTRQALVVPRIWRGRHQPRSIRNGPSKVS